MDLSIMTPSLDEAVSVAKYVRNLRWLCLGGEIQIYSADSIRNYIHFANPCELQRDPGLLNNLKYKSIANQYEKTVFIMKSLISDSGLKTSPELRQDKWKYNWNAVGYPLKGETSVDTVIGYLLKETIIGIFYNREDIELCLDPAVAHTSPCYPLFYPNKIPWCSHESDEFKEIIRKMSPQIHKLILNFIRWEIWGLYPLTVLTSGGERTIFRHLENQKKITEMLCVEQDTKTSILHGIDLLRDMYLSASEISTPKPFCLAPFFHSHVDTEGKNRLCCIAENDKVEAEFQKDLEGGAINFWKSSYMSNRRKMMMEGTPPPECKNCVKPNTAQPYYKAFDNNFKSIFYQDLDLYLRDLTNQPKPLSFDFRTSSCNLKCLMCVPSASSAMNAHFNKHSQLLKEEFGTDFTTESSIQVVERTFEELDFFLKDNNVQYAYFAGGEPTLAPGHLKTLEKILAQPKRLINLAYNTNLMQKDDFMQKWKDLLLRFDDVVLYCSVDALGELGEFLRVGYRQDVFDKNIAIVTSCSTTTIRIVLDVTITSLGLFDLENLSAYAIQRKVKVRGRIVFPMPNSPFMSLSFVPLELRREVVARFNRYYENLSDEDKILIHDLWTSMPLIEEVPDFNSDELRKCERAISVYHQLYPNFKSYSEYYLASLSNFKNHKS